jgi:hypothetical protein
MWVLNKHLGALAACHYCTSHWLAALVVAAGIKDVRASLVPDLLILWLALVGMSALISGLILFFTPFNSED